MTSTIDVPALGGTKGKITGEDCGPFLIHRNGESNYLDDDEIWFWSVSHKRSGFRFPWSFATKAAAEAFANDVLPVMNWDEVEAKPRLDKTDNRGEWVKAGPSPEQRALVVALADKRGGLRGILNPVPGAA